MKRYEYVPIDFDDLFDGRILTIINSLTGEKRQVEVVENQTTAQDPTQLTKFVDCETGNIAYYAHNMTSYLNDIYKQVVIENERPQLVSIMTNRELVKSLATMFNIKQHELDNVTSLSINGRLVVGNSAASFDDIASISLEYRIPTYEPTHELRYKGGS